MSKTYKVVGWLLIIGGVLGGVLTYSIVNTQDFVVALLARVVEQPFEYRSYFALLSAVIVTIISCLVGGIYLGLGEALNRPRQA